MPAENNPELLAQASGWAHTLLEWVGFGTLVGLLAKSIMPGRDPGGAVATLSMGIGGTVIGCGILTFLSPEMRVTPVSPTGFAVATGGAFLLLFFYKLLGGYYFVEGEGPVRRRTNVRYRTRAPQTVILEDHPRD